MNAENALRYAAHQAKLARGRDACEMLALVFPALLKLCDLPEMEDFEADCFRRELREQLAREREPVARSEKPGVFAHLLE